MFDDIQAKFKHVAIAFEQAETYSLPPIRTVSCMHENDIFKHENQISMHKNDIFMRENENFARDTFLHGILIHERWRYYLRVSGNMIYKMYLRAIASRTGIG